MRFWVRSTRKVWEGKDEPAFEAEIKKGEEILGHYCDVDLGVEERREWAAGALGGECRCERCVWEAEWEEERKKEGERFWEWQSEEVRRRMEDVKIDGVED
jgi:hypothetical protein